jgi:hypothetical protein
MPQRQWSPKRERQYEHIKSGLVDRGDSEGEAEEIAARMVNKDRARAGEAATASRGSGDRYLVGPTGRAPVSPG